MMNRKMAAVTSALIGLMVVGTPITAHASKALSGAEIRKIFPGSYTLVIYGFDVGVRASKGGGLSVKLFGDTMKGNWSVKGDRLCITLTDGSEKASQCSGLSFDGKKWFKAGGLSFYSK